jgi:phenylacetate-CoA ligase
VTCYSQVELQRAATALGICLEKAGVQAGDRIGNLYLVGDLYGSFIFALLAVHAMSIPAVHVPIASTPSYSRMCDQVDYCCVNTLMGLPTIFVALAELCIKEGRTFPAVHRLIYAGEPFIAQQKAIVLQAFPNALVKPLGYVSADAGFIASSVSRESRDSNLLKVFSAIAVMEIVTEDDEQRVINQNYVPGSILVTNFTRSLTPVIRYPTGDRAEWVDKDSGVFRLLGRSTVAARLGTVTIYMEDLRRIVGQVLPEYGALQAVVRKTPEARDELQCVIAANPSDPEAATAAIVELLKQERPMFEQHVRDGRIAALSVKFSPVSEMYTAKASGKLREVVDLRDIRPESK